MSDSTQHFFKQEYGLRLQQALIRYMLSQSFLIPMPDIVFLLLYSNDKTHFFDNQNLPELTSKS